MPGTRRCGGAGRCPGGSRGEGRSLRLSHWRAASVLRAGGRARSGAAYAAAQGMVAKAGHGRRVAGWAGDLPYARVFERFKSATPSTEAPKRGTGVREVRFGPKRGAVGERRLRPVTLLLSNLPESKLNLRVIVCGKVKP